MRKLFLFIIRKHIVLYIIFSTGTNDSESLTEKHFLNTLLSVDILQCYLSALLDATDIAYNLFWYCFSKLVWKLIFELYVLDCLILPETIFTRTFFKLIVSMVKVQIPLIINCAITKRLIF